MIELYGVPLDDDEFDIMVVGTEPEIVVNRKGARKLADHAPDQRKAAAFRAYLDNLDADGR